MQALKTLYRDILAKGSRRETRTGTTFGVWKRTLEFDLSQGFPAVTAKRVPFKVCVGELIWFLSGSRWIQDLKHYTFNDSEADRWTIWTDDASRWHQYRMSLIESGQRLPIDLRPDPNYVGDLYGVQWRNFNNSGVDQIANLIEGLKNNPHERDHVVMAWNPQAIANKDMALKPCHMGFQCYVDNDNRLHLNWWQRSVDSFLGLPVNIASYSLLTHLLAHWTGLKPGTVSCDLGDTHIYENHLEAVQEYLANPVYEQPTLNIPEKAKESLEGLFECVAGDFSLDNYQNAGVIKAPLSVGSN